MDLSENYLISSPLVSKMIEPSTSTSSINSSVSSNNLTQYLDSITKSENLNPIPSISPSKKTLPQNPRLKKSGSSYVKDISRKLESSSENINKFPPKIPTPNPQPKKASKVKMKNKMPNPKNFPKKVIKKNPPRGLPRKLPTKNLGNEK